jgi:hypothetical protein
MQSVRGLCGAVVLLLGVPAAIAGAALGSDAQAILHVALGVGFLLLAAAAFDFGLPRWTAVIACLAMGVLGGIFLLQGASGFAPDLHHMAYEVLGQALEKWLGYAFLLWCLTVLLLHSTGPVRLFGLVVLAAVVGVEAYSFWLASTGHQAPDALKLTYLVLFLWLLLESVRRAAKG